MSAVVLKRGTIIPSLEISMSQLVEDMTTFKVYQKKISSMIVLMQLRASRQLPLLAGSRMQG